MELDRLWPEQGAPGGLWHDIVTWMNGVDTTNLTGARPPAL
jgi:hypothetical protein